MHQGQRNWILPAVLLFFLLGSPGLIASGLGDAELPSEEIATAVPLGGDAIDTGAKGVKRDCVLLEVFMRPT